jgi:hypothetical protein
VARRKTRRSGRGRTERSWRSGQAKRGRRATARNGGANRLIPTAVLQKTHKAVWLLFKVAKRSRTASCIPAFAANRAANRQ